MSIFKETFRKYVENQFKIRQTLIAKGNSDKGLTSRLTGGPDGLAPGAFYAYGQKQCVIRLSSLVDLMEDIGLDLAGSKFENYKGESFARNFILEGGILSNFERRDGERRFVRIAEEVRGGFPIPGKTTNRGYGDPSIASNPDSDGYGAVPMPGITDANIRTKSAYGSLREAKVNFVCHNLRQLEILELLYMRPGYPVLMEWGWSPYIKNDGSIENTFPSISDEDYFWDDKLVNQQDLQVKIIDKKRTSNGNYDGFVGFITNFNYTARADGGFNCSTELISMGEVIDSLKVPALSFSNLSPDAFNDFSDEEKKKIIYKNSLGVLLQDINKVVTAADVIQTAKEQTGIFNYITNIFKYSSFGGLGMGVIGAEASKNIAEEVVKTATTQYQLTKNTLRGILGPDLAEKAFIESSRVLTTVDSEIQTKTGYIRLDALAALLNFYVIPKNEKGVPSFKIESHFFRPDPDGNIALDPITYTSYKDSNGQYLDVSCDPNICILPHQFEYFKNDEIGLSFTEKVTYYALSVVSPVFWYWAYNAYNQETSPDSPEVLQEFKINKDLAKRYIGGIYINVDFLIKTFEDIFTKNKDATFGDFLKKLLKDINGVCPMHNFGLRVDHEFTDILQIIDLPITSKDLEQIGYDNLFKFNIQSNDTIVREFKYDTQIPNALKATIAINAQAGATADDLDSVTFAAFNRSIKSRLHSLSEKFSENEKNSYRNVQASRQSKRERLLELYGIIIEYNEIFFNFIDKNENDLEDMESKFGNIKTIIKEAQSLELYLEQSTSGYLKNHSIIPINLNMVLDGISGIVIGNVFRIDDSRLPKAYRNRKVAFVVLGEEQNITAGQDWTTNIRGQIVLFPTGEISLDIDQSKAIKVVKNVQEVNFTDPKANEVTRAQAEFAVQESTSTPLSNTVEIERQLVAAGALEIETIGTEPGTYRALIDARYTLVGNPLSPDIPNEGFTLLDPDDGLYEFYQKQNDDGTYAIKYILTSEGPNQGLIVNYGNVSSIDANTLFDIKGVILATGRF